MKFGNKISDMQNLSHLFSKGEIFDKNIIRVKIYLIYGTFLKDTFGYCKQILIRSDFISRLPANKLVRED